MSYSAPKRLVKTSQRTLLIEWDDGFSQELSYVQLRRACPCATCREKQRGEVAPTKSSELPVLTDAETMPLEIGSMKPVGNFGYNIEFSDGHSTGIYTLKLLRSLE